MPDQLGNRQDQHTLAHLSKLGSNLFDSLIKRFSNPLTARRNRFILLFTTALLLTFIILPKQHFFVFDFKPGDIATFDIRAPQDFLVEDRALTEQRRKEVGNNAPIIYNLSNRVPSYLTEKLERTLAIVREKRSTIPHTNNEEWRKLLVHILDTELDATEIRALLRINSEKAFLEDASALLNNLYQRKIIQDSKVFQTNTRRGIEILDNNGHIIGSGDASTNCLEIGDARRMVADWGYSGVSRPGDDRRISAVLARILLPNFFYNREASEIHTLPS